MFATGLRPTPPNRVYARPEEDAVGVRSGHVLFGRPGYPPPAPVRSSLSTKLQRVCNGSATTLHRFVHRPIAAPPLASGAAVLPDPWGHKGTRRAGAAP